MNAISLHQQSFKPCDEIRGEVSWDLDHEPKNLELRLFWFTRGRGTEEAHTHATLPLPNEPSGSKSFSVTLPESPWSVDGKLISVIWALELVEKKGGSLALEEIVMSPTGQTIVLEVVESPLSQVRPAFFGRFKKK